MFKLHIECSKDISELHINFTDGTSSVIEKEPKEIKSQKPESKKDFKETKEPRKKLDEYLNTSETFETSTAVVQKPNIQDVDRPPKVDDNLQNFDL